MLPTESIVFSRLLLKKLSQSRWWCKLAGALWTLQWLQVLAVAHCKLGRHLRTMHLVKGCWDHVPWVKRDSWGEHILSSERKPSGEKSYHLFLEACGLILDLLPGCRVQCVGWKQLFHHFALLATCVIRIQCCQPVWTYFAMLRLICSQKGNESKSNC